jgi:hypothetical protein
MMNRAKKHILVFPLIRLIGYKRMMGALLFPRQIDAFHYNSEKRVLSIDLRCGANHHYFCVSESVYKKMEKSKNKNHYYDKNIFGKYPIGAVPSYGLS